MATTISARYRQDLRTLNLAAAAVHFILSITIIVITAVVGSPFRLYSNVVFANIPDPANFDPAFLTSNCSHPLIEGGVQRTYDDVFAWFRCVALNINGTEPATQTAIRPLGSTPVWPFLLAFEVLTCAAHLYLVRYDQEYHVLLEMRLQPMRWREYSVTNTLMLIAIQSLSGLNDHYLLLCYSLGTFFMNYGGGFLFEILQSIDEVKGLDARRRALVREVKWIMLVISWGIFIFTMVYLFDIFFVTIGEYSKIPTKHLFEQLFSIISILNYTIVVLYCVFPALHLVQNGYYCFKPTIDYILIEKGYIWASLISKSFLSIIVLVATVQRS